MCFSIVSPRAQPIHLAMEQGSNNRHKDTQEINVHKTKINPSLVIILIQEPNQDTINGDCFHSSEENLTPTSLRANILNTG